MSLQDWLTLTLTKQALTEFGRETWVLAAKRNITTQRDLARRVRVHHDTVRNYLHGRTAVPHRFLHLLDRVLNLSEEECYRLGQCFAWGETRR